MSERSRRIDDAMPDLLLVEDNPLHVRLVQTMLAEIWPEGESLRIARRLDAAIIKAEESKPDCVLLDLVLPDADHLDAVKGLVAVMPDVPIVVLSAHEDDELALSAVALGAQDYLVKGVVSSQELARAIRFSLNRKVGESGGGAKTAERGIGIAILDTQGTIRLAEPSLVSALGFSGNELVGRKVTDLSHPEDVDAWEPVLSKRAGNGIREVNTRLMAGDRPPVEVRVELTAMSNGTTTPAAYLALYYRKVEIEGEEPVLEAVGGPQ